MGDIKQSANYAKGSLLGNTFNIYLHGAGIISIFLFIFSILTANSPEQAVQFILDYYLQKLFPYPFNEIYAADTIRELFKSHIITIFVGLISATRNYHNAT